MSTKLEISCYMDFLARAICVVERVFDSYNELYVCPNYDDIIEDVRDKLEMVWRQGLRNFFQYLNSLLCQIAKAESPQIGVRAAGICLWLDSHICYVSSADKAMFSLAKLFPLRLNHPVFVEALNKNYEETGIQISPRYKTVQLYDEITGKGRPLANRDAFAGMNGCFSNICYSHWKKPYIVQNVVIPPGRLSNDKQHPQLKIAFCPMSSQNDDLIYKPVQMNWNRKEQSGIEVVGLKYEKALAKRLQQDWVVSCKEEADIVFFPEMLGTSKLYKYSENCSNALCELYKKAIKEEQDTPILTVLPSFWKDGVNAAMVLYQDGSVLGKQNKWTPFYDVKNRRLEALKEQMPRRLLLIHIPGIHRIAVMLCADFLDFQNTSSSARRIICEELGVSLLIVPSYSQGERDFVNLLSSLKSYGTTVIWGDCCGATIAPRIIGGCSIAGIDAIERFGSYCLCENTCEKDTACIFLTKIPLKIIARKPNSPVLNQPCNHILFSLQQKDRVRQNAL